MLKASDLIRLWRRAYEEKWGYIWGTAGETWTAAKQAAATRATTIQYGSQWIGRRVADCSGLAYWAFKSLGGTMYHGSNTIWNKYVTDKCNLENGRRTDGKEMLPGDPVFLVKTENGVQNRHHIGYFVGGDTVIEAKSTQAGVVTSKLTRWHETAHWQNVEYDGGKTYMAEPVLKKGASGEDVRRLQELLNTYGYMLDTDGKFGAKTEQAVKAFQQSHYLTPDGIVGEKTWEAFKQDTEQDNVPDLGNDYFVMSIADAKRLREAVITMEKILNKVNW